MGKKYLLAGGAGFVGSHCFKRLIADDSNTITVFDNFSSGRLWHVDPYRDHPRVKIIRGDLKDFQHIRDVMAGHDTVFHFAANPDIFKAVSDPTIDFLEGTYLTHNILEAMRVTGTSRIIFTSTSAIYSDLGQKVVVEDSLSKLPISPYGASKLACESLISAYVHMFDMSALIFRFANVVGPHQTHGVAYDFIHRLLENPKELLVMGDGNQTKSYIYVNDIIDAITYFEDKKTNKLDIFNVATEDYLTVKEIAQMVVESLGLKDVEFKYTGGKRGWKGDVPVVYFDSQKIRAVGWRNRYTGRQAMQKAIEVLIEDIRSGKIKF